MKQGLKTSIHLGSSPKCAKVLLATLTCYRCVCQVMWFLRAAKDEAREAAACEKSASEEQIETKTDVAESWVDHYDSPGSMLADTY